MKFYHGTTKKAASLIKENGFTNSVSVWAPSNVHMTYLWNTGDEEESFKYAAENALLTAAIKGTKYSEIAIMELDIPDSEVGDFKPVHPDMSDELMADRGAWQAANHYLNDGIKNGNIKVSIYSKDAYNHNFRYFYMIGADSGNMNLSAYHQSQMEIAKELGYEHTYILFEAIGDRQDWKKWEDEI